MCFFFFVSDYDPQTIEQKEQSQPSCLPLSYVLRFVTEAARIQNQSKLQSIHQQQQQQQAQTPTSPIESPVTPTSTKNHAILGSSNNCTNNSINNNNNNTLSNNNGSEIKRKLAITHHSYSLSSSNRSNTPTGDKNYFTKKFKTKNMKFHENRKRSHEWWRTNAVRKRGQ